MRHIIVQTKIILPLILLFYSFSFSQVIQKDTIYLNYTYYKDNCTHYDIEKKLKINQKRGIQFNLCGKIILFYNSTIKSDTLTIDHFSNYEISTIKGIREKVKKFRSKTFKKRPKNKNQKLYQAYDNNDIFQTFLIEIINDKQFVIYPVTWRNTRIEY